MLSTGHFLLLPQSKQVFVLNHSSENVFYLRVHYHANQTHLHVKTFVRGLVLIQWQKVTWKWPVISFLGDTSKSLSHFVTGIPSSLGAVNIIYIHLLMKLKPAEIALKWPQNGMETNVTHRRVEVSHFYSISFPYFELLHTIVTFPCKLLYLRCLFTASKELRIPVILFRCVKFV